MNEKQKRYLEARNSRLVAHLKERLGADFSPLPSTRRQFDALFQVSDASRVWALACQYGDRSEKALKLIAWMLVNQRMLAGQRMVTVNTNSAVTKSPVNTNSAVTKSPVNTNSAVTKPEAAQEPRMPAEELAKVTSPKAPQAPPKPKSKWVDTSPAARQAQAEAQAAGINPEEF